MWSLKKSSNKAVYVGATANDGKPAKLHMRELLCAVHDLFL